MFRAFLMMGVLAASWTSGCASAPRHLSACSAANSPNALCDMMNPEDLDYLPGREWIVVSQMAEMDPEAEPGSKPKRAGTLLAFRAATSERLPIFPASVGWDLSSSAGLEPTDGWGDPSCPGGPPEEWFQPHGIAVGRHRSGVPLLAVVNHGGREAVELFEIEAEDTPEIVWRGCVALPEDVMANDLAFFADGSFVVTKFMPRIEEIGPSAVWTIMKVSAGWDTGAVYRWTPDAGFRLVPGSEGSAPNGIAIAPDESAIYVAQWGETNVYRVSLDADGPARKEARLEHRPDNLTWTEDGRLLVAGQAGRIGTILGCGEVEAGGCGLDYGVYAIDPETLEVELLFTGKGAASVALEFGRDIFVGTFSGDQIERVTRSH